jgi:basic membrane protein A and related proteins
MTRRSTMFVVLFMLVAVLMSACQPAAPTPAPAAPTAAPPTAAPPTGAPTAVPPTVAPPTAAPTEAAKKLKIAFIFPGLINEGAFNQLAYAALERAKNELGAETTYVESVQVPDAPKFLRDYASQGYDVVVAWSGAFPAAVSQVAPDFPKTSFVTLSDPGDYPSNVWLVGTDFEDAYFLSGSLAALASKTGKVGHVLAIPIPIYAAGALAYEAGAKYVNPNAEVFSTFIGDFNDAVKAKQTTAAQIEQGADVVQSSLDLGTTGIVEAVKTEPDAKVIVNMAGDVDPLPGKFLGGIIQNYPDALISIFNEIGAGKLSGFQTMSFNGMGDFQYGSSTLSDDVKAKLDDIKKKLMSGEIKYPTPADLPKQ